MGNKVNKNFLDTNKRQSNLNSFFTKINPFHKDKNQRSDKKNDLYNEERLFENFESKSILEN